MFLHLGKGPAEKIFIFLSKIHCKNRSGVRIEDFVKIFEQGIQAIWSFQDYEKRPDSCPGRLEQDWTV